MNIDLGDELSRLARSVHDDATADRMTGQVHHMVGRIRRRRAARRTATSVVGVGAVAAVALGGAQLAGRTVTPPATSPPASSPTTSAPTPTTVEFGTCGSTVVDPMAGADPVVGLQATVGEVTLAAGAPTLDVTLRLTGKIDVLTPEGLGTTRLVVARDGVVVGPVARPTMELQSMPPIQVFAAPLVSCEDGAALPAGDYELYALQEGLSVPTDPGLTEVFGGPWPVTIGTGTVATPSPTSEPEPGQVAAIAAAQAALDDLLANPVPNPDYVFPACGTVAAEVLDDGMPPLELDLVEPELTLPAGSPYRSTVRLHTTLGRYVIGNASPNATLVVLRDGVVVGYQWLDPEGLTDVDLADGQTQEFPVLGTMTLCLPDGSRSGPQHWLPPGEYRTMAALDVMLKEIGEPNGDAQSVTVTTTAVSEAGRLTVTWP